MCEGVLVTGIFGGPGFLDQILVANLSAPWEARGCLTIGHGHIGILASPKTLDHILVTETSGP